MKRFLTLFLITTLILTALPIFTFANNENANTTNITNQIVITGEDSIRSYLESKGEEYDPDILEIYINSHLTEDEIYEEINHISPLYLGNDYEVRNKKTSEFVDTDNPLAQFNRPAGKIQINETYTIKNDCEVHEKLTVEILEATLKFDREETFTFSINWSKTYNYAVKITIYPLYKLTTGEIWEKDIWEDDKVGSFEAYTALGDEIRVKKA